MWQWLRSENTGERKKYPKIILVDFFLTDGVFVRTIRWFRIKIFVSFWAWFLICSLFIYNCFSSFYKKISVDCIIKLDTASVVADSELGWFFFCGIKVKRFSGFSKIRWKGFHVKKKKRAKLDGTVCELKAADVLVDGHHWRCDVAGCDWTINMSGLLSWKHLFMI